HLRRRAIACGSWRPDFFSCRGVVGRAARLLELLQVRLELRELVAPVTAEGEVTGAHREVERVAVAGCGDQLPPGDNRVLLGARRREQLRLAAAAQEKVVMHRGDAASRMKAREPSEDLEIRDRGVELVTASLADRRLGGLCALEHPIGRRVEPTARGV